MTWLWNAWNFMLLSLPWFFFFFFFFIMVLCLCMILQIGQVLAKRESCFFWVLSFCLRLVALILYLLCVMVHRLALVYLSVFFAYQTKNKSCNTRTEYFLMIHCQINCRTKHSFLISVQAIGQVLFRDNCVLGPAGPKN